MKTSLRLFVLAVFAVAHTWNHLAAAAADGPLHPYQLTSSWKIGGEGGWDYVTLDQDGRLLYVTRFTHTMIVETSTGKSVADIPGSLRAHGIALVPETGRGFISDGKDGSVIIFDLHTRATLGKIAAAPDADSIIYDPASRRVLVFCGDAHQMIAIAPDADPINGKRVAAIDLGGSPEYAVADGRGKV